MDPASRASSARKEGQRVDPALVVFANHSAAEVGAFHPLPSPPLGLAAQHLFIGTITVPTVY
jgi:hypothetical protein